TMSEAIASGLDGVLVADTAISDVDGERGRLVIAGSDVEQLALACDFETAATRVLSAGGLPTAADHRDPKISSVDVRNGTDMRSALARARGAAWEVLPHIGDALDAADGMDALRAALAHLHSTG